VRIPRDRSVKVAWLREAQLADGLHALALKSFQRALAIRRALAARDPRALAWRRGLAISHAFVGAALQALGDRRGARASYQAALSATRHLTEQELTGVSWYRWHQRVCAQLKALSAPGSE
jgi:tetratricopeptide (TPR) repeat protein